MKQPDVQEFRPKLIFGVLTFLGLLTVAAPWLTTLRPLPPELQAAREIRVTSRQDSGPASLREAIFAADRASGRSRLVIEVERIRLETLLPPLVNPEGVVIDAMTSRCESDAAALPQGPVVDVVAPNSLIQGLRIRAPSGQGIIVRADGVHLQALVLSGCKTGVYLAAGAGDVTVEDAEFNTNAIGVDIQSPSGHINVRNCHFQGHSQAAVWAVTASPPTVDNTAEARIEGNQFEHDYRGVVLMNLRGRVERNRFACSQLAAIHLGGAGAEVRGNRIRTGRGFGVFADATEGVPIEDNEVDHNCNAGLFLRNGTNTLVKSNRIYGNGYGIVVVFGSTTSPNAVVGNLLLQQRQDGVYVVGGSPLLRSNQILNNRGVGLRILDVIQSPSRWTTANPHLEANSLNGNATNIPVYGKYLMASSPSPKPSRIADCSWVQCADQASLSRREMSQ